MTEKRTGWGNPHPYESQTEFRSGSRPQFHYFASNGLSLCAKWGVGHTRELEEGRDDHTDNCPVCLKKKMGMNAAEELEGLEELSV